MDLIYVIQNVHQLVKPFYYEDKKFLTILVNWIIKTNPNDKICVYQSSLEQIIFINNTEKYSMDYCPRWIFYKKRKIKWYQS